MSTNDQRICTAQLTARVMKQWAPPAYYVLTNVRNGTGYGKAEGYADALMMSVWPSRGLQLIGAEFKVSRSDWLREKKDPAKAEKFFKHCHRWYLITANNAARLEEIPEPWGWMVAGQNGLKTMKEAPELKPEPPDWSLFASIFRNCSADNQGLVAKSEVEKIVSERLAREHENLQDTLNHLGEQIVAEKERYSELVRALNEFENASGVKLVNWKIEEAKFRAEGHMFKQFREGGVDGLKKELINFDEKLTGLKNYIQRIIQ